MTPIALALLLAASVRAAGSSPLPDRPEPTAPVSRQCDRSIPLVPGKPVPPALVDAEGLVRCSAVALPTSEALDLVSLEAWGDAVAARYRIDVPDLERREAWWKSRVAVLEEPPPFWETPGVQRWGGRLEVLVVVAALAGIGVAVERAR